MRRVSVGCLFILMSTSTGYGEEASLAALTQFESQNDINDITVSFTVERKEGQGEAFKALCQGMIAWFEQNREQFMKMDGDKQAGLALSQATMNELGVQAKRQGLEHFNGNLRIDFGSSIPDGQC